MFVADRVKGVIEWNTLVTCLEFRNGIPDRTEVLFFLRQGVEGFSEKLILRGMFSGVHPLLDELRNIGGGNG